MKVVLMDSPAEIADEVSKQIIDRVNQKPDAVLGFATGASPVETYKRLIKASKDGRVSFKNVTTFNLDEYCPLSRDNENSYYYFMKTMLFEGAGFDFEKVNFLSGDCDDCDECCSEYRKKIEDCGGIDIQLLGVGTNGHIGFNEPSDKFTDGPFKVKLTESTISSNSRYFADGNVPQYALTMGVGDIMRAKKIILIATGKSKAKAVYSMVNGEVTPLCPASILQKHPDATVYIDKESAELLGKH